MEFSSVLGFLMIVYAFIKFVPKKGRLPASILIILLLFFSFSYHSSLKNDITNSFSKLLNERNILYAQIVQYFALVYAVQTAISSKALKSEGFLEFSLVLDFLKILKESIKLIPKNGKLMGLITTLSLLLPSILLSLFSYLYLYSIERAANSMPNNSPLIIILQFAPPLLLHMVFLLACSVIFQLLATATIHISANAYTDGNKLSLPNLVSRMKTTWRRQLMNSFSRSGNPTRFELVHGALANVTYLAATINITSAVLLMLFMDHASAVGPLSSIVSVVEESSDGAEAQEKAERLVKGQRVHAFMLKLLFLMALVYCFLVADSGSQFDPTRGLLLLNSLSVGKILWCLVHTGLYFRYKREKDEETLGIGKQS